MEKKRENEKREWGSERKAGRKGKGEENVQ